VQPTLKGAPFDFTLGEVDISVGALVADSEDSLLAPDQSNGLTGDVDLASGVHR
jgi:hypothetical protein